MTTSSEARFAGLYQDHFADVYGYCRRRTDPHRAEDAVADVFLTAWRRLPEVPEGRDALLWLYGVAFRVLAHQWRSLGRKRRLQEKLEAAGTEQQPVLEFVVVVRDEVRRVLDAVSRLSPADREVLLLAVWEELPQVEIAQVLGLSQVAVRQRLHRARARLTDEYERRHVGHQDSAVVNEGGGRWTRRST